MSRPAAGDPADAAGAGAGEPTPEERRRAARIQAELLEAAGGTITVAEAAALLAVPENAVLERIRRGRLLGVRLGDGAYHLPRCQFEAGGVVPGLGRVLQAMPVRNGWTRLGDLLEPLPALEGSTLLDLLKRGERDYAVELAGRLHDTGAL